MTRPWAWPDGDPVEITITVPGKLVWAVQEQANARPGGWETVAVYRLVRAALPSGPRPVDGEIPEHLADWLEDTALEGWQVAELDAAEYRTPARLKALGQLLDWAKALLAVDSHGGQANRAGEAPDA